MSKLGLKDAGKGCVCWILWKNGGGRKGEGRKNKDDDVEKATPNIPLSREKGNHDLIQMKLFVDKMKNCKVVDMRARLHEELENTATKLKSTLVYYGEE